MTLWQSSTTQHSKLFGKVPALMFTDRLIYKDPKQLEMEFLWPHNAIQLSLDLDRPEQPRDKSPYVVSNADTGYTFAGVNQSWGTTTISNQLEVKVSDVDVGELTVGGLTLGLKESPKWYQRIMYKLLGFNWKDKQ
jgi:hypothetical protein